MSDKEVVNVHHVLFTPIVTVTVEEHEDGTFHVVPDVHCDFSDSFAYVHNTQDGVNTSEFEMFREQTQEINNLIDSLKLVEYYQIVDYENEPF